jgi:hypothetical protein
MMMKLLMNPLVVRYGIRIDRAPAVWWLVLLLAALVPTWWWMGHMLADGAFALLAVVPLGALAGMAWQKRGCLRVSPRLGWLAIALGTALSATVTLGVVTPGVSALLGVAAVASGLAAFMPVPELPVRGPFANSFLNRVAYKLMCAILLPLCAALGLARLIG